MGHDSNLRKETLEWLHSSTVGGNLGINVTMYMVKVVVCWKGMIKDIKQFVLQCYVCQRSKYETSTPPVLL